MRLKFKIKSNPYQELLEKSQQLVAQMEQHPQEAKFELSPLASPAAKTIAENVNRALYKLPDNIRQAFEMNRFKEMTYNEIAEKMQISPKTVESYISKALVLLRIELKEYFPFLLLCYFFCVICVKDI